MSIQMFPIETAPKKELDAVLLYDAKNNQIFKGAWYKESWYFAIPSDKDPSTWEIDLRRKMHPTHWCPIEIDISTAL